MTYLLGLKGSLVSAKKYCEDRLKNALSVVSSGSHWEVQNSYTG